MVRPFVLMVLCVLGWMFLLMGLSRVVLTVTNFGRLSEDMFPYLFGLMLPTVVCFILASILWPKDDKGPAVAHDNRRNLVVLTAEAANLARAVIAERQYPDNTLLRVVPVDAPTPSFDIQYDLPSNADDDWVGESSGLAVVVAKSLGEEVEGLVVDVEGGQYAFLMPTGRRV